MAGGSIIGALRVVLGLDTAQFETGAKQAEARANQLGDRIGKSMRGALSGTTALTAAMGALGSALAINELADAAKRALDYTDAIADLADRTGASTKLIQEFRYAAQMSGSSVETADEALGKFTKTLGLAQAGSDAQVKLFRDLGVTSADFDVAFRQTLDGLAKLPTVQERNAVALQLFGKSAGTLTGLLGQGASGFDLIARKAAELGIVLRDDVIRNAGVANDQLDTLKMIMDAQFASAVAGNADKIAALAQIAADAFTAITRSASDSADDMTALFGTLDHSFDPLLSGAKGVFANIRSDANWTRESIANILDGVDQLRNFLPDIQRRAQRFDERTFGRRLGFTGDIGPRSNLAGEFRERAAALDRKARSKAPANPAAAAARRAALLPTTGTGEDAASAKKAEADRKRAAAEAKRMAEKAARDEGRYQKELAGERREQLRAQADLAVGAGARYDYEQMILDEEKEARLGEIARDKDLSAEQKKQLSAEVEKTAAIQSQVNRARANEELAKEALDLAQARSTNEQDILQAQIGLVRSSRERRDLEMKLLDLQFRQLRAAEEAVLASATATDAEKQIARERLAMLGTLEQLGKTKADRENAGPLQQYFDSLPANADELNDAYESVAADGLKQLNDGLADAITGSKSLGDVFHDLAGSIIADLARIAIQQAIIKPLAERMSQGASGGGFFSSIGKALGLAGSVARGSGSAPTAGGASFDTGAFAAKYGIAGLASGGSFRIGGRAGIDRNVLSINGMPRAVVSADERVHVTPANDRGRTAPATVQLLVGPGQFFEPSVRTISGDVSVQTITTAGRIQASRARQQLG